MILGIIDPVGIKAGMDKYSLNLKAALDLNGFYTLLYSNFEIKNDKSVRYFFDVKSQGTIQKLKNIIFGHYKSYLDLRKNNCKIVILHFFSFELKDFLVVLLASFFNIKIAAIVHDVSGFAKRDSFFYRNIILNYFVKHIVVHNQFSKRMLLNSVRNRKSIAKIKVIKHGNFISNEMTKSPKRMAKNFLKIEDECKYILFFGQIKKVKGLDVLLHAVSIIKDSNIKLIIAGKPWKDDFNEYNRLIEELGISNKLHLLVRYISEEEKAYLFSICDFIVLPYREIYQSGVLLMAMSNKTPVITSDLEPFKEVLNLNQGLIFKNENYLDLANKITFALENEEILSEMAIEGYQKMKDEYDWEKIGKEYKALFG